MRKVRYNNIGIKYYSTLTNDKVYDVIRYIPSNIGVKHDMIEIYSDFGIPVVYNFYNFGNYFFTDATVEFRNKIIDEILS